jgi:uncharacterized protein (AIM24 family)
MTNYTVNEFLEQTKQSDHSEEKFGLERGRILIANLEDDKIWAKTGSMIAYHGDIKFEREGITEHGIGKLLKSKLTGEEMELMKAQGTGQAYFAEDGKKISIIDLKGESITVNSNDLLAFEDGLDWDVHSMKSIAGAVSGGLFNVKIEGEGMVAITTHYDPLTFKVSKGKPIYTDPDTTVAWSGNLNPDINTDVSFKTFIGRESGESIQMKFEGEGFVVVQPYEEIYYNTASNQ